MNSFIRFPGGDGGGTMAEVFDVLLVDDDEFSLEMAQHILTRAGFTAATAKDGAEAIQRLSTCTFGLLVTDIEMPTMGGLALLRWVRGTPEHAELPALALTGHSDRKSIGEILGCGADDYLLKPFRPSVLIEAVGSYVTPSGSTVLRDDLHDPRQPS